MKPTSKEWLASPEYPPEETLSLVCPWSYKTLKQHGVMQKVEMVAQSVGGKVSHHTRKSMTNISGCHGNYKLSFLGREHGTILQAFLEECCIAEFDLSELRMPTWAASHDQMTATLQSRRLATQTQSSRW